MSTGTQNQKLNSKGFPEADTLSHYECEGKDRYYIFNNGVGGFYKELDMRNSPHCPSVAKPAPEQKLNSNGFPEADTFSHYECEGKDRYYVFNNGVGGFYREIDMRNSPHCPSPGQEERPLEQSHPQPKPLAGKPPKRSVSMGYSQDYFNGTCYAHTTVRVVLRTITNIIPEKFEGIDTISDFCTMGISSTRMKEGPSFLDTSKCVEQSINYFLLFTFFYKILINFRGCKNCGDIDVDYLTFAVNSKKVIDIDFIRRTFEEDPFYKPELDIKTNRRYHCALHDLGDSYSKFYPRIIELLSYFYSKTNNEILYVKGMQFVTLRSAEIDVISRRVLGIIKDIKLLIDNNFYGACATNKHSMTLVDYEEEKEKEQFFLIFKHSWGGDAKSRILFNETFLFLNNNIREIRWCLPKSFVDNHTFRNLSSEPRINRFDPRFSYFNTETNKPSNQRIKHFYGGKRQTKKYSNKNRKTKKYCRGRNK
jgi:hypothetical protein